MWCLQYKTGELASRCGDLIRVNVYKDKIKNASLPSLPNDRALVAALTKDYTMLATMGEEKARNRPIYSVTDSQRGAAERLLRVSMSQPSTYFALGDTMGCQLARCN